MFYMLRHKWVIVLLTYDTEERGRDQLDNRLILQVETYFL
jgi:hypothetical protein